MRVSTLALTTAGLSAAGAASAGTDVWTLMNDIGIEEIVTETSYEVRKTFPAALAEGAEIEVSITGYATPALPGDTIRELLLVSDMGLCPFCGSQDHGAALQVSLAEPIPVIAESTRLTLKGTLAPVTDPTTWQSVILKDAEIVAQ